MSLRIIGGLFKGRTLTAPKSSRTRPTQGMLREALFNICQHQVQGARFLDLFAGSGAMGLEALSRGALHATFIERDRQALSALRENIALLQVASQTTVMGYDATKSLKHLKDPFDLIYIDPPYDRSASVEIEALLSFNLLKPEGWLFLEERAGSQSAHPNFARLHFEKSRHFGEAMLHQYRLS